MKSVCEIASRLFDARRPTTGWLDAIDQWTVAYLAADPRREGAEFLARARRNAVAAERKRNYWCGLDLSSAHDLSAFVAVSATGDVHTFCWLPADGLAEKSRADKTPWDEWAKSGHLLTTPGRAIDYDYVGTFVRGIFSRADVKVVAFDRAYMRFLRPALARAGFTDEEMTRFVDHGQGFLGMSPAIRELDVRLLQGKLKHGGHPVLTACANNARVDTDPAGNKKFSKKRSSGRIDALVALAMACGAAPLVEPKREPEYQMYFFANRDVRRRGRR